MSQPSWAAWIEILLSYDFAMSITESQPSWAAWIEICKVCLITGFALSQPSWAAWIEISYT